jgi:hypothetical protein
MINKNKRYYLVWQFAMFCFFTTLLGAGKNNGLWESTGLYVLEVLARKYFLRSLRPAMPWC